jgi:ribosome-associated heat shock protein Hsp15
LFVAKLINYEYINKRLKVLIVNALSLLFFSKTKLPPQYFLKKRWKFENENLILPNHQSPNQKKMAEKVRIDKWLWSVRIFKSRTLASDTIKSNKVKVNDNEVKSSFLVQRNDVIVVKKGGFNFTFKVLDLIEKRVGAPIAALCYRDMTTQEELNKYNDWFTGKRNAETRDRGTGRPTKRERRDIDEFKDIDAQIKSFYFDEGEDD